ncbi:MAG: zf-HC2 domain-containing protein [Gemmatimonadetes bacterium]|nr:zf-HC2 domain-containing protein [Gemmatimonadota bacterium]
MTEPPAIPCEEVFRRLMVYLDGELAGEEQHQVAAHLARCRSCFSRAEFERRLKGHLAELGRAPVPHSVEERIRALIGQFNC